MRHPALLPTATLLAIAICISAVRAADPVPARLMVHPESIQLPGPQNRHRILVTAVTDDGRQLDVTAAAAFASRDKAIVTVGTDGECVASGEGKTDVIVTYQGKSV